MSIIDVSSLLSSLAVSTPSVPSDWTPGAPPSGRPPLSQEVDAAEAAAVELATMDEYDRLFWPKAPPRAESVESLIGAAHASAERRRAEAWLAYTRDVEARAWERATPVVRILRRLWGRLAELDETLSIRQPGLAALLEARTVVAAKSGRTRVRLAAEAVRKALVAKASEEVTDTRP